MARRSRTKIRIDNGFVINVGGFSLIEFLLCLSLGSFLIVSIGGLFKTFRHSVLMQQSDILLQERMRFLELIFTKRIRMAGDSSCLEKKQNIVKGIIRGLKRSAVGMPDKDIIFIKSCVHYHDRIRWITTSYFVDDTHRVQNGQRVYALYEKPLGGSKTEWVEGIRQMHILYGISGDDFRDVRTYLNADQVSDWEHVKSVIFRFEMIPMNKSFSLYITLRERL